jgi:trimeric autotransporter adhesin
VIGVSTSLGNVSTSVVGINTSLGNVSTSVVGISSSLGNVSTSQNNLSTSLATLWNNELNETGTGTGAGHFFSVNDTNAADGNYNNNGATGTRAIAIGPNASAAGNESVALGDGAQASGANNVALGANSTANGAPISTNSYSLGNYNYTGLAGTAPVGTVSVGSAGAERTITNVAAGRVSATSTDAINGSELYALASVTDASLIALSTSLANVSSSLLSGGGSGTGVDDDSALSSSLANVSSSLGHVSTSLGNVSSSVTGISMSLGNVSSSVTGISTSLGNVSTSVTGVSTSLSNVSTSVTGISASLTNVSSSVSNISTSLVTLTNTVNNIQVSGTPAIADDNSSKAPPAVASGKDALAVGYGAVASGTNSVALGNGSTDGGRANTVSVGSPTQQRTISNLAPGVFGTDAVNLNQLNAVAGQVSAQNYDLRAGIASAMATAALPQAIRPGQSMLTMGGATWVGQQGFALGVSKVTDSGRFIIKANAAADTRGDFGGAVGLGFEF